MMKLNLLALLLGGFLFSCSGDDTPLEPIISEYVLDGISFDINTEMYWVTEGDDETSEIRLMEPVLRSLLYDLLVISPVSGPGSVEGTYVYSQTEDIGTYDFVFVHKTDGEDYQWFTNGESGEVLKISKVGKVDDQPIYRVVISNFVLNYGYWDFLAGKWVSQGIKQFSVSYEGTINERQ